MRNALCPGDRVALLAPGSAEYVDLVVALLSEQVVPVPLDPRLTRSERVALLEDLDPALVVEDAGAVAALLGDLPEAARRGLPLARPMHVTSGTTGTPKGVWSGLLDRATPRGPRRRGARRCGASAPTTSTWC